MKIICIDGRDHYGAGGALRGQEMAYALSRMGHDVTLQESSSAMTGSVKKGIDAVILTGTWHQLMAPNTPFELLTSLCDSEGIPCIWWYGSNGSVFGAVDPDPKVRAASEQRIIDKIKARQFIAVICPYSMGIYERHGVPRDKMRLVPSVFDGKLFCPSVTEYDHQVTDRLRYQFDIPHGAFCMGTVGNTPNSKGGDDILRGMAELKEMQDLHYVILHTPEKDLSKARSKSPDGKREGKSEWDVLNDSKALASDLGLKKRVHFIGARFPRVAMPTFYRLLNIYCSPSKAENLGQPLVESQLCGLPLVTYKGFSFDFVACPSTSVQIEPCGTVTDDYGLVIPETRPVDVANAIRRARGTAEMADRPQSMARITREWAYERFHHHNAQSMVDAITEYKGLLHGKAQEAVGDQADDMVVGYMAAADRIEAEIGIPQGPILDVGCNTGAGLRALEERWNVRGIGLEPAKDYAKLAMMRGLQVYEGVAERLPFADGSFGFVYTRHSLEHTYDRTAAIAELCRVLRPGGYLYAQVPIEHEGSPNDLHTSPFMTQMEAKTAFPALREVYWGPQETVCEYIGVKP